MILDRNMGLVVVAAGLEPSVVAENSYMHLAWELLSQVGLLARVPSTQDTCLSQERCVVRLDRLWVAAGPERVPEVVHSN